MSSVDDLAAFLRARLDQQYDEAYADREFSNLAGVQEYADFIVRDIAAKRRLLHAHAREHECLGLTGRGEHSVVDGKPWEFWENHYTGDLGPCFVLRCLALPYADHHDYKEKWRPDLG